MKWPFLTVLFLLCGSTAALAQACPDNSVIVAVNGATSCGTAIVNAGQVTIPKVTASIVAPGAGQLKFEAVAGTNSGTCKIIAYAGTSTTPITVADNVGSGC